MYFSMDGKEPVKVAVKPNREFREAVIRPISRGIKPEVIGGAVSFTLDSPGPVTLELDGHHLALHIFADLYEDFGVNEGDPNVLYFGPGVHRPGLIELEDNQTLYIAAGAVVHTGIRAKGKKNIRVLGQGIICNSEFPRGGNSSFVASECTNVEIRGVVIRDSCGWTVSAFACSNVVIENIKIIGMWRYNADGIDLVNTRNALIQDCFVRAFDDCLVLKGNPSYCGLNVENILIRRNVVWCDWGRALEIGCETYAPEYRSVIYEDNDIIRPAHVAIDVQNGGSAHVHGMVFRDIRVEYSKSWPQPMYQHDMSKEYAPPPGTYMPYLMLAEVSKAMEFYSKWYGDFFTPPGGIYGKNTDILFEDIKVTADDGLPVPPSVFRGLNEVSCTKGIRIDGLYFNGRRIETLEDANVSVGEYASDIEIT